MKTFREIAEMHYQSETSNEPDERYRQNRINALEKLLTEQLNILLVSKQRELLFAVLDHIRDKRITIRYISNDEVMDRFNSNL